VFDERRRQERMPRALAAQQYAIGFVTGTGNGLIDRVARGRVD
jgi:hypothetical protein